MPLKNVRTGRVPSLQVAKRLTRARSLDCYPFVQLRLANHCPRWWIILSGFVQRHCKKLSFSSSIPTRTRALLLLTVGQAAK